MQGQLERSTGPGASIGPINQSIGQMVSMGEYIDEDDGSQVVDRSIHPVDRSVWVSRLVRSTNPVVQGFR